MSDALKDAWAEFQTIVGLARLRQRDGEISDLEALEEWARAQRIVEAAARAPLVARLKPYAALAEVAKEAKDYLSYAGPIGLVAELSDALAALTEPARCETCGDDDLCQKRHGTGMSWACNRPRWYHLHGEEAKSDPRIRGAHSFQSCPDCQPASDQTPERAS